MISVERALQIVLDSTPVLDTVSIPIIGARNMVLAEDIISADDVPSFNMAMIDGFAVIHSDIARASQSAPVALRVDGEVKAGSPWPETIQSGHAVKITSGAALPDGGDTIVSAEFAVRDTTHRVKIYKGEKPGDGIYARGGDIPSGSVVLNKGKVLTASDIGVLAALGKQEVLCHRKPKVSFFASGNDLIPPDQPLRDGKVRAGAMFILQSQLDEYGAEPINLGIIGADCDEVKANIQKAMEGDMFITSTGSSMEDFDFIKGILQRVGMELKFWKVAIRPGKPLIFGTFDGLPVFGLPGNYLSSLVILEEFVRPAICKMQGKREVRRTEVYARLEKEVKGGGGMTHFIRAEVRITDDGFLAMPAGSRTTPSVRPLSLVNGFIIVPPDVNYVTGGDTVKVQIIADPSNLG